MYVWRTCVWDARHSKKLLRIKRGHVKELIILAKGPSRMLCPFDAEVWGVNEICQMIRYPEKITRLFAFDNLPPMIDGMRATGIPICSWQDYADEEYPYDEIVSRFGIDYFSNTIAYMIALAVYEGYEKIRLYGVDMAPEEYKNEMPSVEFWLGVAIGQGIKVEISQGSSLFKTRTGKRYGECVKEK